MTTKQIAAASNGKAAVAVAKIGGEVVVLKFAPSAVGLWSRRGEFAALVKRAAAKLPA